MKIFLPIIVCGLSFVVSGCGIGGNIERSSENVKEAANSLAKGMEDLGKIDPLALNKVLNENKDLRDRLVQATAALSNRIEGTGVIDLSSRRCELRIVGYTGSHRLRVWIDNETNIVADNVRLIDRDIAPPPDFGREIREKHWSGYPGEPGDVWFPKFVKFINDLYADDFRKVMKNAPFAPSVAFDRVDLGPRFTTPGLHKVYLELTPTRMASDRWSFRAEIHLVPAAGEALPPIHVFDIDSSAERAAELGKPLSPRTATLTIRTTSSVASR